MRAETAASRSNFPRSPQTTDWITELWTLILLLRVPARRIDFDLISTSSFCAERIFAISLIICPCYISFLDVTRFAYIIIYLARLNATPSNILFRIFYTHTRRHKIRRVKRRRRANYNFFDTIPLQWGGIIASRESPSAMASYRTSLITPAPLWLDKVPHAINQRIRRDNHRLLFTPARRMSTVTRYKRSHCRVITTPSNARTHLTTMYMHRSRCTCMGLDVHLW